VAGDGRLYAPVYSMTDFVLRMAGDSAELFAPRVDTVRMTEEDFIRSELGPMIALTEGDYVHVFDGRSGMLHKYAPNGALRMRRRLPATLLDSLQDSAGQLVRALDPRGRGSAVVALTKALSVTADGELLLLLHAGRTCGLVIDPDSYRVRRIVVPEEADPDLGMLAGAGHATLRGSAIYALVSDSLIAFRLARRPVRGTG
jgi:hypothetical protein